MSGILLPLIYSSRATGDEQPVNVDKIVNFVKLTVPPIPNSTKTTYSIVFSMDSGMTPKTITWNFADATDRDNDFTSLLALACDVTT